MVAVALLAVAGLSALSVVHESVASSARVAEREAELRRASRFMEAVALWPREDLDARLGVRVQGPWRLEISRPARELYEVVLLDSLARRELLRTTLYRPLSEVERGA